MARALARRGCAVEALCGSSLETGQEIDPADRLAARGFEAEAVGGASWSAGAAGVRADVPPHFRLDLDGVPVTIHRGPTTRPHEVGEDEGREFLRLLDATTDRLRPDVLVGSGGDRLARGVFAQARARGLLTVFHLHNFLYADPAPFADAVLVPSRFAADYYREALGLDCAVLPNPVDHERVRVERPGPKYLTFGAAADGRRAWFAAVQRPLGPGRLAVLPAVLGARRRGRQFRIASRASKPQVAASNRPAGHRTWKASRAR